MCPVLLLSFLAVVLLVAAKSDLPFDKILDRFIYPTLILTTAYDFSLEGCRYFLFSLGEIGVRISVPILPLLIGGMEA
jgi:hypothetical protein